MSDTQIKFSELIHFKPKQLLALKAANEHRYTLFGGAAGPGKSYWLRWFCVYRLIKWFIQTGQTGIRVGLFSEDYPTLKDRQVSKMQVEFPEWLGKLKDSSMDGLSFVLNKDFGGGIIALRNLDDPSKYLSSEFALIAVEELTMNEKDVFDKLRSRLRWTGIEDTKFIAATNPGQIGHAWVKKLWIDRDFDENEQEADQFVYIKALPSDNDSLAKSYLLTLESLPERLKQAYLNGNWDVFDGQYFSEWDRSVHVVEPFEIPASWRRIRGIDHGRAKPTACTWGAVDHDGNIYWYREYYQAGVDADVNAKNIAELSEGETYSFTILDAACYSKTGTGETVAEIYENNGVSCEPSPKNRMAGWALFHEYLRKGEDHPRMFFFSTCYNAIRTIPTLVHDKHRPEDLDSSGDDHIADEISYQLQYLHENKSPAEDRNPENQLLKKMLKLQSNHTSVSQLSKIYKR